MIEMVLSGMNDDNHQSIYPYQNLESGIAYVFRNLSNWLIHLVHALILLRSVLGSLIQHAGGSTATPSTFHYLLPYYLLSYGQSQWRHYLRPARTIDSFNQHEGNAQGDLLGPLFSCLAFLFPSATLNSSLATRAKACLGIGILLGVTIVEVFPIVFREWTIRPSGYFMTTFIGTLLKSNESDQTTGCIWVFLRLQSWLLAQVSPSLTLIMTTLLANKYGTHQYHHSAHTTSLKAALALAASSPLARPI